MFMSCGSVIVRSNPPKAVPHKSLFRINGLGKAKLPANQKLVFKRLKSLVQLGHVPKHDDRSSRAWLYGKLLVTLLAQKLTPHRARYFPLGLPTLGVGDPVVPRVNSVSRSTRSSKLSNRKSPCSKRSIRGIRLHKLSCGKVAPPTASIGEMACLVKSLQGQPERAALQKRLLCRLVGLPRP
jgi:hypothetical protein